MPRTTTNSRFQLGTAVYECRCCTRRTRATGRNDNEHVQLCAECFDLAGNENHLTDNGTLYDSPAQILGWIVAIIAKHGDVSCWKALEDRARADLAAKRTIN